MMIAWKVRGDSHNPAIIVLRPASMRLAMAISPSRLKSSTEPISRRYMRTGSSVRSSVSLVPAATTTSVEPEVADEPAMSGRPGPSPSSASSSSTTLMPISESIDITSSICSDETWSGGITWLSCS